MRDSFKYTWIVLCICCGFAVLMSLIPFAAWQKAYMAEYHRIKSEPQQRIDATFQYLDGVENVVTPEQFYNKMLEDSQNPTLKQKLITEEYKPKKTVKPYQKPLFLRDKNHPEKIKPYRSNWWNFNK
ncbi:MAG: hypothetical protein E7Z87_00625 [Cyanobacteria bacterium SIG26]|nr:hypothetical protein [Cyanobacteria bacterium SIG26]